MNAIRFKVFRFVITRFGTLRSVWPLTQAFDVGLGVLTVITAPAVFLCLARVKHEVGSWPDVKKARHPLGGTQFNWKNVELGHVHSNGVADLRLSPGEQYEVLSKYLAQRHHTAPKSTWVSYFNERKDQDEAVISLFRIPYHRLTTPATADSESPSEEYVQ
jgi:hypothetical protein